MKLCVYWTQQISQLCFLFVALVLSEGVEHRRSRYRSAHPEPEFVKNEKRVTVHQGDTAYLRCTIRNLGTKTVQWRKIPDSWPLTIGDMPFSQKPEIDLRSQYNPDGESKWDLVIKRVKPEDSGVYECKISATEIQAYNVTLKVLKSQYPIPSSNNSQQDAGSVPFPKYYHETETNSTFMYGTEYVNTGQMINLTCNATGTIRAPGKIDWYHNGDVMKMNDAKWRERLKITDSQARVPGRSLISELIIEHSIMTDQGTFICRSSAGGTTAKKIHVLNADTKKSKREKDVDKTTELPNNVCIHRTNFVLLFLALLLSVT